MNDSKNYLLYYSGHQAKSINVEGILVVEHQQVNFEPISDRIWKLTVRLTSSGNKLIITSVYPRILERSMTEPITADAFYNELESVIKNAESRGNLVIAGVFDAKQELLH